MTAARNMLLHGEEIHTIETDLKIDFAEVVNSLGHLAWIALVAQFVDENTDFPSLRRMSFMDMTMNVGTHVEIGVKADFECPEKSDFPKLQMSMTSRSRDGSDEIEHHPIGTRKDSI
jgi:hypothetical protein